MPETTKQPKTVSKKKKKTVPKKKKATKQPKTVRLLQSEERNIVKDIDKQAVVEHVRTSVPKTLMESLFPERMGLWKSIAETKELEVFIINNAVKFLTLYDANIKGSNKYANLYLSWLQVIRSYTCKTEQTAESRAEWGVVLAKHGDIISEHIQRTVIATILNSVQDGTQAQMAAKIEQIDGGESNPEPVESLSDDTALYRISGWALKSAIQIKRRAVTKSKVQSAKLIKEELQLLEVIKRSQSSKSTLPLGVQYLDRGGLTFIHSSLLPWVRAVESSMKQYMTQAGYKRYGKQIFKVIDLLFVLE